MIKVVKTLFFTLLFILGVTFAMQNSQGIVLRYYFGMESPEVPVFLLVLFAILFGVLLTGASYIFDEWSLKRVVRQKEREIAALERELRECRERDQMSEGRQ